jgi:hypothetical protein
MDEAQREREIEAFAERERTVEVRWWRYTGSHADSRSAGDFGRVERKLVGANLTVSVFRTKLPGKTIGSSVWHLTLVGPAADLPRLVKRVKHGRSVAEPEKGINDAVKARREQHMVTSALSGREFGWRHYPVGAELDARGGMTERRPQG